MKVEKLNPIAKIIAKETVELEKGSTEERTAVRFTLDAKGEVTATSHIQRSILQTFHSTRRNGAP